MIEANVNIHHGRNLVEFVLSIPMTDIWRDEKVFDLFQEMQAPKNNLSLLEKLDRLKAMVEILEKDA